MLTIRSVQINDSEKLYNHLSNPYVVKFSRLKPTSIEDMEKMITNLKAQEEERKVIPYVIVHNDEQIGMITLWHRCLSRKEGFLATWLGEEHWGKGFNKESKEVFLQKLFTTYEINRVLMIVRDYNERSIAACNKLHYVKKIIGNEESEIRLFYKDKIESNHLIFSINKDDFLQQ